MGFYMLGEGCSFHLRTDYSTSQPPDMILPTLNENFVYPSGYESFLSHKIYSYCQYSHPFQKLK